MSRDVKVINRGVEMSQWRKSSNCCAVVAGLTVICGTALAKHRSPCWDRSKAWVCRRGFTPTEPTRSRRPALQAR